MIHDGGFAPGDELKVRLRLSNGDAVEGICSKAAFKEYEDGVPERRILVITIAGRLPLHVAVGHIVSYERPYHRSY